MPRRHVLPVVYLSHTESVVMDQNLKQNKNNNRFISKILGIPDQEFQYPCES